MWHVHLIIVYTLEEFEMAKCDEELNVPKKYEN